MQAKVNAYLFSLKILNVTFFLSFILHQTSARQRRNIVKLSASKLRWQTFHYKTNKYSFSVLRIQMKKLSRFRNEKNELSIEASSKFLATKLAGRFMLSRALLQEGSINFHLGLDLVEKKQVVILSTLVHFYQTGQLNPISSIVTNNISRNSPPTFFGKVFIESKEYYMSFRWQKKKESPSVNLLCLQGKNQLRASSKQSSFWYIISHKQIQFLLKLQAVRPTQLDLNIDTLQVVFGTEQKKIHIQMLNRNIYKLEKLETLKKNSKRQTHSNGGRVGRASFCLEKKYNGFQQVRILFEKIMQIQKLINGSSNKKEVKLEEEKVNFLEVMKKILSFIQSSSLNREAIETWNYAISEVLKNQYHLKEDMLIEEMTKLAESLVASKTQKIKIYWDNLVTSKNLRTQSQDEEQELFDCFDSEEEKELSVSGKIVDHMLVTKPGNPTFLWQ